MVDNAESNIKRIDVLQVVSSILLTVVTLVSAWTVSTVVEQGKVLAGIQASRWTSTDQSRHEAEKAQQFLDAWQAIAALKQEVAVNTERIAAIRERP